MRETKVFQSSRKSTHKTLKGLLPRMQPRDTCIHYLCPTCFSNFVVVERAEYPCQWNGRGKHIRLISKLTVTPLLSATWHAPLVAGRTGRIPWASCRTSWWPWGCARPRPRPSCGRHGRGCWSWRRRSDVTSASETREPDEAQSFFWSPFSPACSHS